MTEIKNRIILDDQMSAALEAIVESTTGLIETLGGVPVVTNRVIDSFKHAEEQIIEFHEATSGAFTKLNEKNLEMLESFEKTNEKLIVMIEKIEDKSKAIEGIAKSIEKAGKSSGDTAKGFKDMTDGVLKIVQSFKLIPPQTAKMISGVAMLNRGIAATIPKAAGLAAKLAPLTLVATAVMGIVNAISRFRRSSEDVDEVSESFDGLVQRAYNLASESKRMAGYFETYVELIHQLEDIGASEDLLRHLEGRSEIYATRAQAAYTIAAMTRTRIVKAAMRESSALLNEIFGNDTIMAYQQQIEQLYQGINNVYSRGDHATAEYLQRELDEMNAAKAAALERYTISAVSENYDDFIRVAGILAASTDEAHQLRAQRINEWYEYFNVLTRGYTGLIPLVNEFDEELEKHKATMDRIEAVARATAAVQERTQQHIIRSYRDTYAAAESLQSAHYALSHAINGTSSEYMSQLDIFNKVMNLSPEYLNFLFDERGNLLDIEDAVTAVTQSQIQLMGVRQANAILDSVEAWVSETGALYGYSAAIITATDSVWGFVEARMADIKLAETQRLMYETGMAYGAARSSASRSMLGVTQQISAIQDWTAAAGEYARNSDLVRADTINTAAGRAMVVADPANWAIRDEIVRLKEDVTTRQFASGIYQQRGPVQIPQIQLPSINVYATPGMNEEQLARRVAKYCASYVADEIVDAYNNDLLIAYG